MIVPQIRKNNTTSNEDRKRITDAYNSGSTIMQISSVMNIKRTTVHTIIKKYIESGSYESKRIGGNRPSKMNAYQKEVMKGWVDNDCSLTLKKLKEKTFSEFGINVSSTTIAAALENFNYSLKRIHVIPERRNDSSTVSARFEYATNFLELLKSYSESQIIYIDEVGFNVCMRATRGRSIIGSPAIQVAPGLRTRNISVCCGMNCDRVLYYSSQVMAFNTSNFVVSIEGLSNYLRSNNFNKALFVMDNVPFHRSSKVKETIENNGWELLYLPPYSPFLNPIENLFSKWKESVRRSSPNNEEQLLSLIENGAELITSEDCSGYYRNMFRYIRRSLNGEIIED
jgi:transposase